MTWAGRLRAARSAAEVERRRALYAQGLSGEERERHQLERLNREWDRISGSVPHYRDLRRRGAAPDRFRSLAEFAERIPPTTRSLVQSAGERLAVEGARPDALRITGGSTSTPVQIPAWASETRETGADVWVGRGWYRITPASRLFLLWGHAHLLGTGWRGFVRARKQRLSDRLLGYERFSAYDLRAEAMRRAGDALLRFRPDYFLGYSVALDLFARANADRCEAFHSLGLKLTVGTAEAFPSAESAQDLARILAAPVAMEYGAVETGLIAHTHPSDGYRVFWSTYLVEAEPSAEGRHLLRVTSLYPRLFPLVRYEVGDEVELEAGAGRHQYSVDRFERVVGRCNDYVPMRDGARIHSELFSHAVRPCPEIRSFQVVHGEQGVRIRYTAAEDLSATRVEEVRQRLSKIHPDLGLAAIVRAESLPQTLAGKTRMVVEE